MCVISRVLRPAVMVCGWHIIPQQCSMRVLCCRQLLCKADADLIFGLTHRCACVSMQSHCVTQLCDSSSGHSLMTCHAIYRQRTVTLLPTTGYALSASNGYAMTLQRHRTTHITQSHTQAAMTCTLLTTTHASTAESLVCKGCTGLLRPHHKLSRCWFPTLLHCILDLVSQSLGPSALVASPPTTLPHVITQQLCEATCARDASA